MSPADGQQSLGIGSALKDGRRRMGMDVKEAEERTKIRARYLRALEAEDWEALPGGAYVRGFLRTYGELLGLDGEKLADEFRRRYESGSVAGSPAAEPILQERRRAPGSRPPSRGPLIAAIAFGIVLLLVILGAIGDGGGDGDGTDPGAGKQGQGLGSKDGTGGKKGKGDKKSEPKPLKPIDVKLEPLDTVTVCLVGGGDQALIDSQALAAGMEERYSDFKRYRLDLQGGGDLKLTAGAEGERLSADADVSYEFDSRGIREVDYAGPDCP